MKLYDIQANIKGKYIYFGGSIIFCDDKNVCSVYNNTLNNKVLDNKVLDNKVLDNKVLPSANINTIVSSI